KAEGHRIDAGPDHHTNHQARPAIGSGLVRISGAGSDRRATPADRVAPAHGTVAAVGGTEDGGHAGTRAADERGADPDAGGPSRLPWRWFAGTFLLVLLVYGLSPVVTNG